MPIFLVTGVPRSGKSYYSVHKIKRLLETSDPFIVIANIEGLNVQDPRVIIRDFEAKDFENERMAKYLQKVREENGLTTDDKIYLFIDEAQRYFPKAFKDSHIIYFFDYHAHYYIDIYLIAQNSVKICKDISCLAEYEFRAVSNTVNPLPVFKYKVSHQGEQFESKSLRKDPSVFAMYKSQHGGKPQKKKKKLPAMILLFFVIFGAGIFLLFDRIEKGFGVQRPDRMEQMARLPRPIIDKKKDLDRPEISADYKDPAPLCPLPEKYIPSTDRVVYCDPDLGICESSVKSYVSKFRTFLYGYGYFHVPYKSFVITSCTTQNIVFPTDYQLPQNNPGMTASAGRIYQGQHADRQAGALVRPIVATNGTAPTPKPEISWADPQAEYQKTKRDLEYEIWKATQ